jgi:hypothetical protein
MPSACENYDTITAPTRDRSSSFPVSLAGMGHFCSKLINLGSFHDVISTLDLPKRSYDTVWQLTPGTSFHPEAIFSKR